MPENILIAIAWPYANAEIHVGNITGSHLPGDIVARYHRLNGNPVIMVSGTDAHGTPVTVRSEWRNEARNPRPEYINAIAAELMGAQSGLGFMIMVARRSLNTQTILLGIIIIGLLVGPGGVSIFT